VLGLLSDGGCTATNRIPRILDLAVREGLSKVCLHVFLDGRDTPPKSAEVYLRRLSENRSDGRRHIGSMIGYFAMDRDRRWRGQIGLRPVDPGAHRLGLTAGRVEAAYAR
jgi:2,3-bisphosphoglycerate-independent phosphoglycerate mutase